MAGNDENWAKYGFPDDIMFRSPYLPAVGLCKAYNERMNAEGFVNDSAAAPPVIRLPEYFTPYPGMQFNINVFQLGMYKYVNPDKVETARRYRDCFWDSDELVQAAAGDMDPDEILSYSRPEFSAKWALFIYNAINILRYVPVTSWQQWPDEFEYEDRYDTFNFKAEDPHE